MDGLLLMQRQICSSVFRDKKVECILVCKLPVSRVFLQDPSKSIPQEQLNVLAFVILAKLRAP